MVYERRDDGPVLVGRSGLRCLDGSSVVESGHCFSTAGSGRGLAVEAGKRVFEHAFSVLSLPLLVGVLAPDNTAAIRARKSVVEGKSGSVREDVGGSSRIKTKKYNIA